MDIALDELLSGEAPIPRLGGGLPWLGHLLEMRRDHLGLMRRAERELGPVFALRTGPGTGAVFALGPGSLEILRNRATSSAILADQAGPLLGGSMIVQDGRPHQRLRSALNPPFTPRGLTASAVGERMADLVAARVARWHGEGRGRVLTWTRELTLSVIFRIVGLEEEEFDAWRRHYEAFTLGVLPLPLRLPGTPGWRAARSRRWLDARLGEAFARLRERGDRTSFLGQLVHAQDDRGAGLDDGELVDNVRLLLLAGHETSATVMAWMLIHLAQEPDAWRRLREETAGADLPRSPGDLARFPIAEALFRECLRLHPPVVQDLRVATEEVEIHGLRLPAGAPLGVSIGHLCRHPAVYADGDAFRLDRWLGRRCPPGSLETIPFGAGPHFCLGYHLAWMEAVQFAVAVGRAGRQPRLIGAPPRELYMPLAHPEPGTQIGWS